MTKIKYTSKISSGGSTLHPIGEVSKVDSSKTFLTQHSRDFYRGASFHYSGQWKVGSHYISDNYEVDFVVHNNVLLACTKSHLSSVENEPINYVVDSRGTIVGVNSDCWDFIIAGIVGKSGKIYFPMYDSETGELTWNLISEEDIDSSELSASIPMALADLKDDPDHRLVTDTEINAWNDLISQVSSLNVNKADKAELDDYVKKINNPFAVGTGLQSAFQKNPEYANTASGRSSAALGESNTASGIAAVAIGANNEASGGRAFASGRQNVASGNQSTAEGYNNTASGAQSHAEGSTNTASGVGSHVEGYSSTASAPQSHAEGRETKAIGNQSHAEGSGTTASETAAHAEGTSSVASGDSSHAEGHYTTASGRYSHSEGHGTKATSDSAHAEGWNSEATGSQSHAEGNQTKAKGFASHSEGQFTITNNNAEHAEGFYNKSNKLSNTFGNSKNTIHSIGIGTSDINRRNAIEIMQNGDTYIYGIGGYDGTNIDSANTLQQSIYPIVYNSSKYLSFVPENGCSYLIKRYSEEEPDVILLNCGESGYVTAYKFTNNSDSELYQGNIDEIFINCNVDATGASTISVANLTNGEQVQLTESKNLPSDSEQILIESCYIKPSSGIPASDIADNAIKTFSGIPIKGTGDIVIKIQRALTHGGFVVKNAMSSGCVLLLVSEHSSKFALFIGGGNLNLIVVGGTAEDYFITDNRTDVYINVFDGNFSILLLSGSMPQIEVPNTKPTLLTNLTAKSIQDTSNFVTTSVNNLVNYYTKSETYTKSEVSQQIANALIGSFVTVQMLPPSPSAENLGKIYLIPADIPDEQNIKQEYIAEERNGSYYWEKIGTTAIDLSDYVTDTDLDDALDSIPFAEGTGVDSAEQRNCMAVGDYSVASGYNTIANGSSSHTEGGYTTANGDNAHAEGYRTTTNGANAHIEGRSQYKPSDETIAKTNIEIINDWNSQRFSLAKGNAAHVEGYNNLALSNYAHAEGASTIAIGAESHAEGYFTKTTKDAEHAEGKYNLSNANTIHSIGIGTADNARANAVEVTSDGKTYIKGIGGYTGNNQLLASDLATVVDDLNTDLSNVPFEWNQQQDSGVQLKGAGASATGFLAYAEGSHTVAGGDYAHAEGDHSVASGLASYAGGIETHAANDGEAAFGMYNKTNVSNTLAGQTIHSVGVGSEDERKNAFEIMQNGDIYVLGVGGYNGINPSNATSLKDVVNKVAFIEVNNVSGDYFLNGTFSDAIQHISNGGILYITGDYVSLELSDTYASVGAGTPAPVLVSFIDENEELGQTYIYGLIIASENAWLLKFSFDTATKELLSVSQPRLENADYKVTSINAQSTNEYYPSAKAVWDAIEDTALINTQSSSSTSPLFLENLSNKVTSISSQSTDIEYPSAKCVYDAIQTQLSLNPAQSIFWATCGTTTASEVQAAIDANKIVLCNYTGNVYRLESSDSNYFYFSYQHLTNSGCLRLKKSDNTWDGDTVTVYQKPITGIPASDLAPGVIKQLKTLGGQEIEGSGEIVKDISFPDNGSSIVFQNTGGTPVAYFTALIIAAEGYAIVNYTYASHKVYDYGGIINAFFYSSAANAVVVKVDHQMAKVFMINDSGLNGIFGTIDAIPVATDWSSDIYSYYQKPSTGIPASDLASGVIPTISTDITTDASSNTKTASPKAVKDYVDANGMKVVTYGTSVSEIPSAPLCYVSRSDVIDIIPNAGSADDQITSDPGVYLTRQDYSDAEENVRYSGIYSYYTFESNASVHRTCVVTALYNAGDWELEVHDLYDEIHPTVASSQPSGGFLPNVMYNLGTLSGNTTFALATPADANIVNHYYWTFDTGSTAPTITWPSSLSWFGGSAPTINASKHYEISVLNGIAVAMEV